ncbi:hypothetical protein [Natrialba asiatica]|uniref:Uncharacterized protein n=1 Tax=Natrialba asiatica (strain ATCC 700177 / DSM 12278 / JCM 9576 / FERM P-10747 / NBRC 102637 / 172P1) TaxID=29540 RepID=M0AM23_NATA1|nr:hypothetical protein [Natrialba asiatica]ELY99396.1 hypothetical protein C481_16135 [Natrialba asiatica DSM 12278]
MYDDTFGTDWESIDGREEVVERAYALGVATRLGETYPDERDRLTEQVGTTYDQSFVDLAYQKGRDEAAGRASEPPGAVWEELVEGQTIIEAEETDDPEDTLPDAIRGVDIDTPPADSTETLRKPAFLERQRANQSNSHDGKPSLFGDGRSIFGRSMAKIRRSQENGGEQDDGESGTEGEASERDGNGGGDDRQSAQSPPNATDTESKTRGSNSGRNDRPQSSRTTNDSDDGSDRTN